MNRKIVMVDWEDSTGGGHWTFLSDQTFKTILVRSVGYLLDETDEHLTISCSVGDDGEQAHSPMTIPKRCIVRHWEITIDD